MTGHLSRYRKHIASSTLWLGIAAAAVYVVAVLIVGRLRPGHQPIFYDSAVYLEGARAFFSAPSLHSLTHQERPVFAWPLLLVYRLIGADPPFNQLVLHNLLFSLSLTLLTMLWITRLAAVGAWAAFLAFALFCSFFPVTLAGAHFNGDILMVPASLALAAGATGWLTSARPGPRESLALAGLFAWAVNVKPIITPWALSCMVLLWAFPALTGRLRRLDFLLRLAGMTAATALLVWIFWPLQLAGYIRGIYFNNQVLDNFVRHSSPLTSLFWFPIELARHLPIIQLTFLALLLAYLAKLAYLDRKRLLGAVAPLAPLWTAWILGLAYVSVFVKAKDPRSFLLFFPALFVLVIVTAARASERRAEERLGIGVGAAISLLASIVTFFLWGAGLNRPTVSIPFMPFETAESSGMLALYSAMRSDVEKTKPDAETVTALLLENEFMFTSSTFNYLPSSLGTLSQPVSASPRIAAHEVNTRYGMWGDAAGIPAGFFSSRYILHCLNDLKPCYTDNPAARRISAMLTAGDPSYLEGLTRVAQLPTVFGKIEVLRRDRVPSARNFVRIVRELVATDEQNLWNYPFVLAASRLDPSLKRKEAALREAAQGSSMPSYFEYARGFEWGRALLAKDETALGQIVYPDFLASLGRRM